MSRRYNRRDAMFLRPYTLGMGLRIRELREARGLTQAELSDMARLSRSQLSEIETESKPANTLRLAAIAKALDVSVEELFTDGSAEAYRTLILDLMRSMSPEDRDALLRMARALAGRS